MRILSPLLVIIASCSLVRAASINWTNHLPNVQVETNAYVGTSVNVGAGFADARLYPDSGPAVTPFRLQSTALRLSGNIFEVSNGPGFLILSSDYAGLLSAPDLLLTGDASVQGGVLTDHVVATNGVVTGGLTNTSVSQLQGAVTANQVTSTNVITAQAGINTAGITNTGVTVHTPSAIQTLAAGTVITWDSSTERVAGSGGAVTLTGTPTIQTNNVPDGALITIRGTSDANTVTLQDYRLLTGTCIAMEVGTVTLKNGSETTFQWSVANQRWQATAPFSANSSMTHSVANETISTNLTVGGTGGGSLIVTNGSTTTVPLVVNQAASGSVDMFQVNGGGTNWVKIDAYGTLNIPDGLVGRPSLQFATDNDGSGTGFFRAGANQIGVSINGTEKLRLTTDTLYVYDTASKLAFGAGVGDLYLGRESAAVLQQGQDAASPIAQTFKGPDGSGTDKPGGDMTFGAGKSTGTGKGGTLYYDTSMTAEGTGSTQNAFQHRYAAPAGYVALTHATATTIATFSLAANKVIGGHICSTVWATNNVPHLQSITSDFDFAAVCTGTTIVPTLSTPNSTPQAVDSGTLTLTGYTAVDNGNNTFSIKVNVSSDLASPTERCRFVVTTMNGSDTVTFSSP